ncbi:MAG: hypothetical protein RRC07_17845, partial [Anaerolineae bacterium]|nr:hypothetical protein [Anaerolineae bacterium]
VFESWAGSDLFRILAGEPALTIIPNLLVSGVLTILFSLTLMIWAIWFVERKHAGWVLIGLSLLLLLVGGGFGPPLLGTIVGATATRIHAPLRWWRTRLAGRPQQLLAAIWPWAFAAAVAAWLSLFPGTIVVDYFFGLERQELLVSLTILVAFVSLLLAIVTALAHDLRRVEPQRKPALSS